VSPIRLLLIEDSEEDAFFLLRYLKRDGRELSPERVETTEELATALEGGEWDVVVSDWSMPTFDALDALALVRKKDPDLPFIIVSGTIGEERAVEAMKAGAHDYVPKSTLARLWVAIEREMEGARGRWEKRRAEEKYRSIFENAVEGIFQTTAEGRVETANPALARIFGYASPEELISSVTDIGHQIYADPHRREEFDRQIRRDGVVSGFETRLVRKDEKVVWASVSARAIYDAGGRLTGYEGTLEDITERKRAEEALKESEEQLRATFEQAAVGMAHVSPLGKWLRVNDRLCEILGYRREELLKMSFQQVTHPEDLDNDLRHVERILEGELRAYSIEKRYLKKDSSRVWIELSVSLVRDHEGAPRYFIFAIQDINERKLKELVPRPLPSQEIQVLKLLIRGRTNQQIARDLDYSLGAIKLHVRHILDKLGVKSREEAALRAVEIGLLPPDRWNLRRILRSGQ
jgi:PAS domain S-box-containing protein